MRVDENIPDPLVNFTLDHRILTRAGKALEGISEAIATIQEEHQRFVQEIRPVELALFNSVHQSLAELKRMATELRREMEYMATAVSKSIDVVSDFSPFPSRANTLAGFDAASQEVETYEGSAGSRGRLWNHRTIVLGYSTTILFLADVTYALLRTFSVSSFSLATDPVYHGPDPEAMFS